MIIMVVTNVSSTNLNFCQCTDKKKPEKPPSRTFLIEDQLRGNANLFPEYYLATIKKFSNKFREILAVCLSLEIFFSFGQNARFNLKFQGAADIRPLQVHVQ